jgi:hypothetical protein
MKSSIIPSLPSGPSFVRIGLTIFSVVLSGGFAIAQPTPGKTKPSATTPEKTPEKTPTASQKPTASPKPSPTPETKIDAKTGAELLLAEDRFIIAIQNRDAKALGDLLADYYADSFRDDERAINKRGFIERATEGKLTIYRVEKERKLIRSGDTFTVEGLAKKAKPLALEENPKEEWVHVRRLWLRQRDRWLAIAQIIALEENESNKDSEQSLK